MGNEEESLAENLVPPETLDNPDREWTKGERQPAKCRDAWAAILFYAQFIAIAVVGFWLGLPAFSKHLDNASDSESGVSLNYDGMLYVVMIAAGASFVLSAISLAVMSACPKILIQISLLFSVAVSLAVCVTSFMYGSIVGGVFGVIFFLLSCCYAYAVWRRIPFAAANLATGLTAVKKNAGVFFLAYIMVAVTFGYSLMWITAIVGVYDKQGYIDENGNVSEDPLIWVYFFLLLLALFWSEQVFQNTIHVVVAGVVSTWWFAPEEAGSCCSAAVKGSFFRATTTSFGSICFGSLLVAIIQTLRSMVDSARQNDDVEGCAAFLLCIVSCLLSCLEGIMEYFNKYAYIYVGMYGYSYLEAGKNVMTLFRQKGWTVIITDDLISNTLSLFNIIVGLLTGAFGVAIFKASPDLFASSDDEIISTGVAFGFPFLIGIVISAVLFSVVDSSVNTVIVSFAEAPAEFEENHPKLSAEMREAWRLVYPAECGF